MTSPEILDRAAVAARLGVKSPQTVTIYVRRGWLLNAKGERKADLYVGRSPAWYASTIDAFLATRPGRGAGGGRPKKAAG